MFERSLFRLAAGGQRRPGQPAGGTDGTPLGSALIGSGTSAVMCQACMWAPDPALQIAKQLDVRSLDRFCRCRCRCYTNVGKATPSYDWPDTSSLGGGDC